MRPQKILDKDMLTGLTKVFREKGYEGASLNELAEVTGLKKASLYHRFPKGKQEMAEAVFTHLDEWVTQNIFFSLKDETQIPELRLKNGLAHIRELYNGGNETCIFRAFSMQAGIQLFEKQIKNGMNEYINAFIEIGIALNLTNEKAKNYAVQTLIEIQGSLIVSKGLNDCNMFEIALQNIEKRYINT